MSERQSRKFKRREVLKVGLQATAGAVFLGLFGATAIEADKAFGGRLIAQPARNALDSLTQAAEQVTDQAPPYIQTAIKTAGYTAAELLAAPIARVYKPPIGSRVTETEVAIISRAGFFQSLNGLLPTVAQEAGRWILSFSLPGNIADDWKTGIAQASMWAMVSNVKYGPNPERPQSHEPSYFPNGKLPLFQAFEQYYFWRVIREKGLPHSLVAHSFNLGIKLVAARLINRVSRQAATELVPMTMEAVASDAIKESVMSRFLRIIK